MLVHAPKGQTTGFISWYADLWLEERLTLRAFTTLLSANRFFSVPSDKTIEKLLADSANDQSEVTDQLGCQVRHAVEVSADSVFDAAARGLAALVGHEWTERVGPATRLEIQVLQPVVTHTVTVQQLARWAAGSAASPEERVRKDRVGALIATK
jgi:hypothetical protein